MHHRVATTAAALLLCACLLLTGCTAQSRQRILMRNDLMASATWDGLEFLGSEESEHRSWKSPPTAMTRCFKMTIPLDEAFDRILETAYQNDWRLGYTNSPKSRIASKTLLKEASGSSYPQHSQDARNTQKQTSP